FEPAEEVPLAFGAADERRAVNRPHELVERPFVVIEKVEAPDLVRTVVRAVTGADATIVSHHVQPLLVMARGVDRADVFARRGFAMLAKHRLHDHLRLFGTAGEIAVDAN